MTRIARRPLRSLALALLADAGAARAAPVALSANAGIVSDYRFRGLSLSDRGPAAQGGVDATTDGWFAGAWGSTIARYGGAHVELDVYAGRGGTVAGFDYSVGGYAYLYPGGSRVDYGEAQASLERSVGKATLGIEAAYVPEQRNTGTDNIYAGAKAELALGTSPVRLTLHGGYEDGFYDGKLDWQAGVAYAGTRLSASAALVGARHAGADAHAGRVGGVVAVTLSF